ncbi:MAG: pyrimidine-nucleoside phosphorylase [Lachnospiraceae bacterium]|nr:pyrimidine-nucleoside phosphorylase [Lachnospiraceae bacterium]MDE6699193.1 pyrimidine-nucleoside phosphorylase [Lachnospiraceae bacterium]
MNLYDIITKKKRSEALTKEEIDFVVSGYTNGEVADYQMSALLMAICINGMNEEETFNLTISMRDSGDILDLSEIDGIKVDKHSTGGVGDKISLILSPMLAALGVKVAKMSGRGLGHTGGTIDKLESIKGFTTTLSRDEFLYNVNNIGMAIAGQSANLAPADKKIYALRDVTATVDCIPLIASSIMSKKLASGADAIVLDVKCGNGAFMKTEEEAKRLAQAMVSIGRMAGKKISAVITDMNEPLGSHIGNGLEVAEVIETLKGNGNRDILEVTYALGSEMLIFAKKANTKEEARNMLENTIADGSAYEKFTEFVKAQKGDISYITSPEKLVNASVIKELKAKACGYISELDTENIGRAVQILGGGRSKKDDIIDMSVGLIINKKTGSYVKSEDTIFTLYGNDKIKVAEAIKKLEKSVKITAQKPCETSLIKEVI